MMTTLDVILQLWQKLHKRFTPSLFVVSLITVLMVHNFSPVMAQLSPIHSVTQLPPLNQVSPTPQGTQPQVSPSTSNTSTSTTSITSNTSSGNSRCVDDYQ